VIVTCNDRTRVYVLLCTTMFPTLIQTVCAQILAIEPLAPDASPGNIRKFREDAQTCLQLSNHMVMHLSGVMEASGVESDETLGELYTICCLQGLMNVAVDPLSPSSPVEKTGVVTLAPSLDFCSSLAFRLPHASRNLTRLSIHHH